MSSDNNLEAEAADICASCGKSEVDDVKLKPCDGCDLVRYCSDACREDHRPDHEVKCKERGAELRDEILFKQPESSHMGDCPICCLPLPMEYEKSTLYSCCSKTVCDGCNYANGLRQLQERRQQTCPFCRKSATETREEADKNLMKRIAANDPVALFEFGNRACDNGDYEGAFKYFTKAAELGEVDAYYELYVMYREGHGVEKDEKKELCHLEEAAIAGHPYARYNLAVYEMNKGKIKRAVKHFIIAANLGFDGAMKELKDCYKAGDISKDDFAAALRAHHVAVKATKSPQREAAAKWSK